MGEKRRNGREVTDGREKRVKNMRTENLMDEEERMCKWEGKK